MITKAKKGDTVYFVDSEKKNLSIRKATTYDDIDVHVHQYIPLKYDLNGSGAPHYSNIYYTEREAYEAWAAKRIEIAERELEKAKKLVEKHSKKYL
jgi:hypothetical protein